MHRYRAAATLSCGLLLTACGGGGALAPTAGLPQPVPHTIPVSFRILIPSAISPSLRPAYVSASTQSATIVVTPNGGNAGAPTTVNCTTVCSGTVSAPVGSDTFTVKLFDAQSGSGNLLSTGSTTQTIALGQANTVNVTFDGVVKSLAVSLGSATAGTSASVPVTVKALDADGNTIVGPGGYVDANGSPVTIALSDSDATGATSLSASSIGQPGSAITLNYSGLAIAPATITASASGFTNAAATFTPTLQAIAPASLAAGIYVNANGTSSPQSFNVTETGWTNAPYNKSFTATLSSACSSIATVAPASGTSFAVTLVASPSNGSCTLSLTDGAGQSLVIPIGYRAYSYTGAIATFTPPPGVTLVNITAIGAGGGGFSGGTGASESGTFTLASSTTYDVLVGGAGATASNGAGSGGGGSFVYAPGAPAPLIAAGGGGGAGLNTAGLNATSATSGVGGDQSGAAGGSGGNGGGCVTNSGGGGGYSTGGSTCNSVGGGASIVSGGAGGSYPTYANGGFGGGGAAASPGGGGGGYSGGGAGGLAALIGGGGGGGSFNSGTNAASASGAPSGQSGSIIITW